MKYPPKVHVSELLIGIIKSMLSRTGNGNLNDDVRARARAWWGTEGDPPIDMADMRTGECGFVPMDEVKI